MSDAKKLDGRMLEWQKELRGLEAKNQQQVADALAQSISGTLGTLRKSYAKFQESGGTENRYTIERQTKLYNDLVDASGDLLGPKHIKQVKGIYERDLKSAYSMGGQTAEDIRSLVEKGGYNKDVLTRMPIAAQIAAGKRLEAFWDKESAALRQKVTQATLGALQTGKGWKAAQADIANALRTDGKILRSNDALSVTARKGIVMNLEQRANLIARTELAAAYVQGQMSQYRKNGYTHGRWSATGERTCPFCAAREGAIYPLDELDAAIPAHPRCRCTVAPVAGEAVKRALESSDQAVGAARHLDDAGWTAIRQQRFNEFQKFTGKQQWDPGKYLKTPTSSEKFFKGPNAKAAQPAWIPSGGVVPNLAKAEEAAREAEKEVQSDGASKLTPEEEIAASVMADKRFTSDAQRTREMRAQLKRAGLDPNQDFVELVGRARDKGALTKEAKAERKDLKQQEAEAKKAQEAKAKQEAEAKAAADAKAKAETETKAKKEAEAKAAADAKTKACLLYTSPSPRD